MNPHQMVITTSKSQSKTCYPGELTIYFDIHVKTEKDSTSLSKSQTAFREALCDSFNTPEAMVTLRDLVSKTNVYINSRGTVLNVRLVRLVAEWVGNMLRMFGLGEGEKAEIGWGQVESREGNANVSSLPSVGSILGFNYFYFSFQAGRNFDAIFENIIGI